MDNKRVKSIENVNGNITSNSFKTYSLITSHNRKSNFSRVALFSLITILVISSLCVFGYALKDAFLKDNSLSKNDEDITTINTFFEKNDAIKVELVTKEISEIFNVPRGIKIVELKNANSTDGLRIDDIITEISGMEIHCLDDVTRAYKATVSNNSVLTYKVYRNGMYETITPLTN